MGLTSVLSRYIGRQFLLWFTSLLLVLLGLILLIDTVELLRRAANRPHVTLDLVLQMALLKLPGIAQQLLPFAVLFSAMFTFWKLTRSQELVVARAIGVSVWRFSAPVLAGAALIGLISFTVLNPIGSTLVARYQKMEDKYLRGNAKGMEISRSGLWLRQQADNRQFLFHAGQVVLPRNELRRAMILVFDADGAYVGRFDAPVVRLDKGRWRLRNAWYNEPDRSPTLYKLYDIPTDFRLEQIEDHFAPPQTISFWKLPRFIRTLEETGFSAIRHRLHWQSLMAQPFIFCAMVLFAAAFSLRLPRRGGTLLMISAGIATGFALFVATDVILTIGMTEAIPVSMAAWTPAVISLLFASTILLHSEDG